MPRAVLLYEELGLPGRMAEQLARLDVAAAPHVEFLSTPLPRLLMGPARMARLGLSPPFSGFMEQAGVPLEAVIEACVAAAEHSGTCYAATTAAMMAEDPSPLIVAAITRLWPGLERVAPLMELALVEAVANALIHGNLGIGSGMRISAAGLREFNRVVAEALADSELASRWVAVTVQPAGAEGIIISVTDQGAGYAFHDLASPPVNATTKSGRGLDLIRKLARKVEGANGGRTIKMHFGY